MQRLKVQKKPTESEVLMVTKKEISELKEKYGDISISNHDEDYLKQFKDDDIVGVIAGDLDAMGVNDFTDLWFINIEYFNKQYILM